jgi:hypothetical protein
LVSSIHATNPKEPAASCFLIESMLMISFIRMSGCLKMVIVLESFNGYVHDGAESR